MTTLKKTLKETIKKEVVVNLPYFSKSKNEKVFYKVLAADRMVKVNLYDFHTAVEYTGSVGLALDSGCVGCLELEFDMAFAEAMSKLSDSCHGWWVLTRKWNDGEEN